MLLKPKRRAAFPQGRASTTGGVTPCVLSRWRLRQRERRLSPMVDFILRAGLGLRGVPTLPTFRRDESRQSGTLALAPLRGKRFAQQAKPSAPKAKQEGPEHSALLRPRWALRAFCQGGRLQRRHSALPGSVFRCQAGAVASRTEFSVNLSVY